MRRNGGSRDLTAYSGAVEDREVAVGTLGFDVIGLMHTIRI